MAPAGPPSEGYAAPSGKFAAAANSPHATSDKGTALSTAGPPAPAPFDKGAPHATAAATPAAPTSPAAAATPAEANSTTTAAAAAPSVVVFKAN